MVCTSVFHPTERALAGCRIHLVGNAAGIFSEAHLRVQTCSQCHTLWLAYIVMSSTLTVVSTCNGNTCMDTLYSSESDHKDHYVLRYHPRQIRQKTSRQQFFNQELVFTPSPVTNFLKLSQCFGQNMVIFPLFFISRPSTKLTMTNIEIRDVGQYSPEKIFW